MLKVLVGVLSFAVIVFFASQSFAHANSHAIVDQPYIAISGNHYDIQYDGNTCAQWVQKELVIIVQNPIIEWDNPIGGFNVVSCTES